MTSSKRLFRAAALLLVAAGLSAAAFVNVQGRPPKPLEFEVADGPGAPTEVPGIVKIEAALLFAFDGPVGREDVAGLSVKANGVALPPSLVDRGRWDKPRPRMLRVLFLLEEVLKLGVEYLPDSAALRFECVLSLRDGSRFSAASAFDFVAKDEAPEAFRAKGRFVALPSADSPLLPPSKTTTPAPVRPAGPPPAPRPSGLVSRGAVIAEAAVGPEGGRVSVPGQVSLSFPPGALRSSETIRISKIPDAPPGTHLFFIDRDNEGEFFAKPVEVELAVGRAAAPSDGPPLAIQELDGPLWKSVPGRYDPGAGTMTCRVLHFSPLGSLTKADVKTGAGAAIGAAVGVYLIMLTPAGVISIPGIFVVGMTTYIGGALANPVLDEAQALGLNRSARFGADFRVHWTDSPASKHHLLGDHFSVVVDPGSGAVLALEDKFRGGEREALDDVNAVAGESVRPFDRVVLGSMPKPVLYLAAELAWTKRFYERGKFAFLADGTTPAPLPFPFDIFIYSLSDAGTRDGEWDGTKLLLDKRLFSLEVLPKYAAADKRYPKARQATVAHEYWHAVYTRGAYHHALRSFDWFDECMGIAFESEVFPDRDLFLDSHPAGEVKVSLATGFSKTGTKDGDNDRFRRGYKFWPWGKFLLNRGYDKVVSFGRGTMTESEMDALFGDFALALVGEDRAIPDRKPSPPPADDAGPLEYIIPFPEGMEKAQFDKSISTTTGWASLSVDKLLSGLEIKLGDAGAAAGSGGFAEVLKGPRTLSFVLAEVRVDPSKPAADLAAAGTPPPVVVRRARPEEKELTIGLHPSRMNPASKRRRTPDLAQGWGKAVVPGAWMNYQASTLFPVAFAGTSTEGGDNPVWAYVLLPPQRVLAVPEAEKVKFSWEPPVLGPGLKAESVYAGYRVFTQKSKDAPVMVPDILLRAAETKADVPADKVGSYDRIGLAAEDAAATDAAGKPLLSPIAWLAVVKGEVTAYTSKPNPDKKSPFDEEPLTVPVGGAQVVCEFVEKGKTVRLSGTSDKDGRVRFEVPLDVEVTLAWGAEKETLTCTAKAPKQSAVLGGVKLKTASTSPVKKRPGKP